MASHKSAAKRARQTERKNAVNNVKRSTVRTWEKKVRSAISAKNAEEATTYLKKYTKEIFKAAKKNIFHKNLASRKVSRLSSQVNSLNS